MNTKPAQARREDVPITKIQSRRLASLTGVDLKAVAGESLAKLSDKLKWQIDPTLLFFRKICGKVVKKDPVTGQEYPVPYATVYVEDTDCHLISYFPYGSPYVWHFPFSCHREVIGVTKTDACGNFCVLVPRFDIDWILRWRRERFCYPIIFQRPNLGDLLRELPPRVAGPWPPIPGPDPGPLDRLTALAPSTVEALGGSGAGRLAREAGRLRAMHALGASTRPSEELLDQRLFDRELPPPLPEEFHRVLSGHGVVAAQGASPREGIRSAVAARVGLDPQGNEIAAFDIQRFIGPFWRCYDVFLPEWQLILDVPDITFRVTQDTNGDGTEETIHSESHFDVRWDAGNLPNVTLVASSIAKETRFCSPGNPPITCGNVPAILTIGLMTVTDPSYFGATSGYAVRPNRPSTSGSTPSAADPRDPAKTPFCGSLQYYGCVDVNGAQHYRVLQSVDDGTTFTAVTGQAWNNYSNVDGHPIPISADANGWYAVKPFDPVTSSQIPRSGLEFPNLVLDWWTPDGRNIVKIELGDAAKNHISESATVAVQADNSTPSVSYRTLSWKFVGEPDSALRNLLGIPCPTIHRGATPQDIEVVFAVDVSAHHLRNAQIWTDNCGLGAFSFVSGTPSHWHASVADNAVTLSARYTLAHTAAEGAYSFNCNANSRAMNPSGGDGGNHLPIPDWFYDPVYLYVTPRLHVAIVNEN
jgi:hypothetical protein